MIVMGILNTTPDSFFEPSRVCLAQGIEKGLQMVSQGAEVLDIGGESTRPGSEYIEEDEEIRRVIPLVEGLRKAGCLAAISVDTRKKAVAKAAFEAGANWINDVAALQDDPNMGKYIAQTGMKVVLMHSQGQPKNMQNKPQYTHVTDEVEFFFQNRVQYAYECGIKKENIFLDPGIGFGKTTENNIDLLRSIPRFKQLGFPILVGLSRKSLIGALTGEKVENRLPGSLAAAIYCATLGTSVMRVHDVAETVQALKVWQSLRIDE